MAAAAVTQREVFLHERGTISFGDVLAAARRDWLAGWEPGEHALDLRDVWRVPVSPVEARRRRELFARAAGVSSTAAWTAAALVALEMAITMVWQEPLSYFSAQASQGRLERDLEVMEAGWGLDSSRTVTALRDSRKELAAVAEVAALARDSRLYARSLDVGEPVGRISMPSIAGGYTIVQGAEAEQLALGPGHLPDTALPGQGRTTTISGHRTTYGAPFRHIDDLRIGDEIKLELPYGSFVYEVEREAVVDPDAYWVTRDVGRDRLVLTTCHPEFSAAERYIVFASLKRSG